MISMIFISETVEFKSQDIFVKNLMFNLKNNENDTVFDEICKKTKQKQKKQKKKTKNKI